MIYSYIQPRRKTIFTEEMQLLATFFSITLMMLFFTYGFLLYKDYSFSSQKQEKLAKEKSVQAHIKKLEQEIKKVEEEKALSEKIYTKNTVLKDSISNLFDLVPVRITLSRAELLKNGLILYGITPNKDVYNFMLQAPLRSIFHRTYSSFYPVQNGWLHFVSTNYMDEEGNISEK